MKGVLLAGGSGTRLLPLTKVTNKHLLPVGGKPMVYWPIETLVALGVTEMLLVTGGDRSSCGQFMELVGDGRTLGLNSVYYAYQPGNDGIADALYRAADFTGGESFVCVLGDNVFDPPSFDIDFTSVTDGATVVLYDTPDAYRYGVPKIVEDRIREIIEKPAMPETSLAVTGLYFYDPTVYEIIANLRPSERGELEITDVNNQYAYRKQLRHIVYRHRWIDAGTHEALRGF